MLMVVLIFAVKKSININNLKLNDKKALLYLINQSIICNEKSARISAIMENEH